MKKAGFYFIIFLLFFLFIVNAIYKKGNFRSKVYSPIVDSIEWHAPDINALPPGPASDQVRYGKDLIANTAIYLGPKGSVASISNGMNCQNCHLDAGTRLNSNSFAAVAATYPKFKYRSGKFESIEFRINECMERSLNGKQLDSLSKEMQAMKAYLLWMGNNLRIKPTASLSGTVRLSFLSRAADTTAGKIVFLSKCSSCHGQQGKGLFRPDSASYLYPPLWGSNSYNVSAGLYSISKLAGFIKYNMPFATAASAGNPPLTDEEAWDVAAFINSQQRPVKFFKYDWPDISTKPVDYPFGPFADSFSTTQHKYGPFEAIISAKKNGKYPGQF